MKNTDLTTKPRLIIIVPNDYDANMYRQPEEIAESDDVSFVKYSLRNEVIKLLGHIPSAHQTYLRCPYENDKYFRIEDYEIESWKYKILNIADIARCLGATEASFDIESGTKTERTINSDTKAGSDYGSIGVQYSNDETQELKMKLQNMPKFDPDAKMPTREEYKIAERIAKQHNLYNDSQVQGLLKFRDPNDGINNKLSEWVIKVSLCGETNADLKFAANLATPSLGLNVDSDFRRAIRYENSINIAITFKFSLIPANSASAKQQNEELVYNESIQ